MMLTLRSMIIRNYNKRMHALCSFCFLQCIPYIHTIGTCFFNACGTDKTISLFFFDQSEPILIYLLSYYCLSLNSRTFISQPSRASYHILPRTWIKRGVHFSMCSTSLWLTCSAGEWYQEHSAELCLILLWNTNKNFSLMFRKMEFITNQSITMEPLFFASELLFKWKRNTNNKIF